MTEVLAAVLAALESAGVLSSVAVTILTDLGVSGSEVTILKAVADTLSNTAVTTAFKNMATQIAKWCDGDASVSAADLIALCDTIKTQSAEIQALE